MAWIRWLKARREIVAALNEIASIDYSYRASRLARSALQKV